MTGHLVLSTLHATDSISAVLRLVELGVERPVLASALIGVIAQRLIRVNCPPARSRTFRGRVYLDRLSISADQQERLRVSNGCPQCKFTGSRGRHGLFELLEVRGALRDRISNDSELEIRKAAREADLR